MSSRRSLHQREVMPILCKASPADLETLNRIAYEAEAYWEHDESFMEIFASVYKLTGETLKNQITYLMVENNQIIGFFSIIPKQSAAHLDYFYIRREQMGKGLGRKLWNHLLNLCREKGFKEITGETEPGALPFYTKMGAIQVGTTKSKIDPNKDLPKFQFSLY